MLVIDQIFESAAIQTGEVKWFVYEDGRNDFRVYPFAGWLPFTATPISEGCLTVKKYQDEIAIFLGPELVGLGCPGDREQPIALKYPGLPNEEQNCVDVSMEDFQSCSVCASYRHPMVHLASDQSPLVQHLQAVPSVVQRRKL